MSLGESDVSYAKTREIDNVLRIPCGRDYREAPTRIMIDEASPCVLTFQHSQESSWLEVTVGLRGDVWSL